MPTVNYITFGDEIVAEERDGVMKDYMRDPQGNVIALLDETQTQTDTFTYWPYGEVRTRTGTTPTPFQFNGAYVYYADMASGLTYVRARHLNSVLARWMTVDPEWPQTVACGYANGAPNIFLDPSGRVAGRASILTTGSSEGDDTPSNPSGPCHNGRPKHCNPPFRGTDFCKACHCKLLECCGCCLDQFDDKASQNKCRDNCRLTGHYDNTRPIAACPVI